jgi:hypothetical protein
MPIILLLILMLAGCAPEGGDEGEARGIKVQQIGLAWDLLLREGDEAIASFELLRAKNCDNLQTAVTGILNVVYTDRPPFNWHRACYQVVARSVSGAVSPPSNEVVVNW